MPKMIDIPKEELVQYYCEQNMLQTDIGKMYGCTGTCISEKVKKYGLVRNYQNEEWLRQKHLVEKKKIGEMAEESRSSEDSIRRWMRKYGIDTDQEVRYSNMGRYSFDTSFFTKVDTEEKAYWLGFIVADGCINIQKQSTLSPEGNPYLSYRLSILLAAVDKEHLEKFKQAIQYTGPIEEGSTTLNGKKFPNAKIRISSKKLCEDLMQLNVMPRKSCEERVPDSIPEELKRHFIRGYFDGDGCFSFYKVKGKSYTSPSVTFVGGKDFLEKLLAHFLREVFQTKVKVKAAKNTKNHVLEFGGNQNIKSLLDWMYEGSTIHLDRKYNHYQNWLAVRRQEDIVRPSVKAEELGRNDLALPILAE